MSGSSSTTTIAVTEQWIPRVESSYKGAGAQVAGVQLKVPGCGNRATGKRVASHGMAGMLGENERPRAELSAGTELGH